MDVELVEHYGAGVVEDDRLRRTAHGRLELLRTQELIRARLTRGPVRVLDVGGGTGVHASWLVGDGHTVHVIDPVPGHVQAAAALPGVSAEVGDARALPVGNASVDVVLLLGPLYHLRDAGDRALALAEARRVVAPGGLLVAAAISRYIGVLELGGDGRLTQDLEAPVGRVVGTGEYDGHAGFVPAHFHTAPEIQEEVEAAGWDQVSVYGVEGPAWPALDAAGLGAFETLVDAALRCARLVERDPHLVHASAHLMAIATT